MSDGFGDCLTETLGRWHRSRTVRPRDLAGHPTFIASYVISTIIRITSAGVEDDTLDKRGVMHDELHCTYDFLRFRGW